MLKVRNGYSDLDPKQVKLFVAHFYISYHVTHLMSPEVTVVYICNQQQHWYYHIGLKFDIGLKCFDIVNYGP